MPTKPEEVGVSSPRLARIGEHWQRHIDAGKLAGTVTLMARRGQVVFMTQLMPSSSYPLRRELRVLTYASLVD